MARGNAATQNIHYIYKSKIECPCHTHSEHIVFCRLALENYIRNCWQYTGSPLWNSGYEGSKINLLSKIWIFLKKMPKVEFFKKSEKNLLTSKMEQNPSSCSIGIWNYHLAPSKLKSKIFLCPYACPLCKSGNGNLSKLSISGKGVHL